MRRPSVQSKVRSGAGQKPYPLTRRIVCVAIEALSAGRKLFRADTADKRDHAYGSATLLNGEFISLCVEVINGNIAPNPLVSNEANYRTDSILERKFAFSWNSLVSELSQAGSAFGQSYVS